MRFECAKPSGRLSFPSDSKQHQAPHLLQRFVGKMLAISATSVSAKRNSISSRGATRSSSVGSGGGGSSRSLQTQFKMDDNYDHDAVNQHKPIFTSMKATKCIRPKEWTPEVEEGESEGRCDSGLSSFHGSSALPYLSICVYSIPSAADGVARRERVHGNVRPA